ncbi:MAG TPA: hypothetical protein VFN03_04805 [Trueperaceae bacterium]|nr:hypothetical protein [Trueperaceae bacterium]
MHVTGSNLIRLSGIAAMAAGVIFIGIQPVHPADVLESTTTAAWGPIMALKTAFAILGLVGITGVYARQVEKSGPLGLAGYVVLALFFTFQMPLAFIEAVVLPPLSSQAPGYVSGVLGAISSAPSDVNIGAFPAIFATLGAFYLLGGVLFGIATFRAGVLPRGAGGLLVFATLITLAGPLLGHPLDRILAVPMGLALAWLGYSLWSDRQAAARDDVTLKAGQRAVQY